MQRVHHVQQGQGDCAVCSIPLLWRRWPFQPPGSATCAWKSLKCSLLLVRIHPPPHHHQQAVLLKKTTVEAIVDASVGIWVACYGVPSIIMTDRGVQFTSAMCGEWCAQYSLQHITTTPSTLRPTVWWRDCTTGFRKPYMPWVVWHLG